MVTELTLYLRIKFLVMSLACGIVQQVHATN